MGRAYAVTVGSILTSGGQSPVSLVAADGEIITGSGAAATQSNFTNNGFYKRNGLTFAQNWSGPNPLGGTFAGFDDPAFLPITTWLTDFVDPGMYDAYRTLGVNGFYPQYSTLSPVTNAAQGFWSTVINQQYATPADIPSGGSSSVVGVLTGEEPYDDASYTAIVTPATAWLNASGGTGRIHEFNWANHALDPFLFGTSITPAQAVAEGNPGSRRRMTTCDMYWFAGQAGGSNAAPTAIWFRLYQHLSTDGTADQVSRGCHYGSMVDALRVPYTAPGAPVGVWVENGAPFDEAFTHEITVEEMCWAIWSIFTHGGRSIQYFNATFRASDLQSGVNNFGNPYYGSATATGTGIFAAARECNLRALQIAPVLNGPKDGYRCWGTTSAVTQTGFLTAATSTHALGPYAGVDVSCRWNPLDQHHYLLATTRESGTATNIPLTVRMVDQGQIRAVPVFGGSPLSVARSGGIPAGFCEFTDVFASARDYKVWRVE
jgi:hypothetical protein